MIRDFPAHPVSKATGKSSERPSCIMDEMDMQLGLRWVALCHWDVTLSARPPQEVRSVTAPVAAVPSY